MKRYKKSPVGGHTHHPQSLPYELSRTTCQRKHLIGLREEDRGGQEEALRTHSRNAEIRPNRVILRGT